MQLLTDAEHKALSLTGELADTMNDIMGNGSSFDRDWQEFCSHIHVLQNMIMAQAAARAYPDKYRLLGGPSIEVVKHVN